MPDGSLAHHTLTPEKPRASRAVKAKPQTHKAAAVILTNGDPDACLHEMIGMFRASMTEQHVEWEAVNRLPKRHPDYKPRMAALLARRPQHDQAEKQIALTTAQTMAGAQAKAQLGYDMLAGDDPQANDLLHDNGGGCRMWSIALAGTRDMVRLTGGLCGEKWDNPDRNLLETHTEFQDSLAS